MMACVSGTEGSANMFPVTNGVKQGFVLALTSFSIFLSSMLQEAFRECTCNLDGCRLLQHPALQSQDKTTKILVRELLFADDIALILFLLE